MHSFRVCSPFPCLSLGSSIPADGAQAEFREVTLTRDGFGTSRRGRKGRISAHSDLLLKKANAVPGARPGLRAERCKDPDVIAASVIIFI